MLYTLQLGHPQPCPRSATIDGTPMGNLDDAYWAAHGGMEWHRAAAPEGVACSLSHAVVDGAIVDVWTAVVAPPVPQNIIDLREGYRNACRNMCALAGVPVRDKLETGDYVTVAAQAYKVDAALAGLLADTMLYALSTLRLDDGRDAWDRI